MLCRLVTSRKVALKILYVFLSPASNTNELASQVKIFRHKALVLVSLLSICATRINRK